MSNLAPNSQRSRCHCWKTESITTTTTVSFATQVTRYIIVLPTAHSVDADSHSRWPIVCLALRISSAFYLKATSSLSWASCTSCSRSLPMPCYYWLQQPSPFSNSAALSLIGGTFQLSLASTISIISLVCQDHRNHRFAHLGTLWTHRVWQFLPKVWCPPVHRTPSCRWSLTQSLRVG